MSIQETIQNDAGLEAMLYQFQVAQPEGYKCQSGNPFQRMCIEPDCDKQSLICSNLCCQNCQGGLHHYCSSFPLNGVTSQLKVRIARQQNFLNKILEIESRFIKDLRGTGEPLAQKYRFGNLEERQVKALGKIYSGRQNSSLKGKEAKDFVERLKTFEKEQSEELFEEFLKIYRKTFQTFLEEVTKLKKKFIVEKELDKSRVEMSIVLNPPISTNILEQLRQDQIDFLNTSLGKPHKIQRIFKASEHNFSAAAFHKACDGKNDTLVLVRTEFGKTIGGYIYYPWNTQYYTDSNQRSFIFSLDLKEKYVPQKGPELIQSNHGPTFGADHDLYLADNCNKNLSSMAKFPTTYNRPGNNKIKRNQESFKNFSGATNGPHFWVIQYEVYQVLYQ